MRWLLYIPLLCALWMRISYTHKAADNKYIDTAYRRYHRAAHNYYSLEEAKNYRTITPPEKLRSANTVYRTLWQMITSFQNTKLGAH